MKLTKTKIKKVKEYCKKMFPIWRKRYSTNIVGVHLGFKRTGSSKTDEYAVVFHVVQKLGVPIKKIPKEIFIRIDNEKFYLHTDVIETGVTKLMGVMMGERAQGLTSLNEFGTVGLYLPLNSKPQYVCSNMHVLAPKRIRQQYYTCPPEQQYQTDVMCSNDTDKVRAFLQKAEFDTTDLAIARLKFPEEVTNSIKGIGQPVRGLNDDKLNEGMDIKLFGAASKRIKYGKIVETGVVKKIDYDSYEVIISTLVATSIPVEYGDSGSAVVNDNVEVVGILVSKDEVYSYVIPWSKINSFMSGL